MDEVSNQILRKLPCHQPERCKILFLPSKLLSNVLEATHLFEVFYIN